MKARRGSGALLLAATAVLLAGCKSSPQPPPDPEHELVLEHMAPPYRLCQALQQAAASGERRWADRMLDFLEHDDPAVRACAHDALSSLVGGDPVGYRAYGTPAERKAAVAEWRERLASGEAVDAE